MSVRAIEELQECRALWERHYMDREGPLDHWTLRCELAELSGTRPHFLLDTVHETVLPLGKRDGRLVFFGGKWYAENNCFLGPPDGRATVFSWLKASNLSVRLLSWREDPLPDLPKEMVGWDVPFNQNWQLQTFGSFDEYLDIFDQRKRREFRYLETRSQGHVERLDGLPFVELMREVNYIADMTAESFRARGLTSTYSDPKFRRALRTVLRFFHDRGELVLFGHYVQSNLAGIGVLIEELESKRATYLCNLYSLYPRRPYNKLSAAVLLNLIRYATDRGLTLDAMRGAFGHKPSFGFRPKPRYAIVRDPDWTVELDGDLSPSDQRELYGREFGALVSGHQA